MRHDHIDTPGIKLPAPVYYLAALAISLMAKALYRSTLLPSAFAGWRRLTSVKLIVAGLALAGWSVRTMQRHGTSVRPDQPALALVEDGPFRYSRNPIYLGMTLGYTGITLLLNNLWGIVLLPVLLTFVRRGVIEPEERYLTARFGEQCVDYTRRVRRWF